MPEPTPPEYFNERKRRIFRRIYQNAAGRGNWESIYRISLEMLAVSCDMYLTMAEENPNDPIAREFRAEARWWLESFMVISEKQIPLGEVDNNGIDVLIKKLAE